MDLQEKLLEDMKQAMKTGDKTALETIRMIRAQMKNQRIAEGRELDEQDILSLLSKEAKKRKESVEMYAQGGRGDLAEQETRELGIIEQYLPKALTPAELESLVLQAIQEAGAESMRDMGKVMSLVMPRIRGRADGRLVQDLVKSRLS